MADALLSVVASVFGLVAILRVRDLGPRAAAGRRAVAVAIWGLAVGTAVLTPAVDATLIRLLGVPYVAEPLARTAIMVAAVGAQSIFLLSTAGDDTQHMVRRRIVVLVCAVVAVWAAFFAAAKPNSDEAYLIRYGQDPWVASLLAVYLVFLGWCFVDLIRAWRRMGPSAIGHLRLSLRLLGLGAVTGCGYVAFRLLGEAGLFFGWDGVVPVTLVACQVLGAITGLMAVAGVIWPSARESVSAVASWWAAYRAKERLYPLWRDLVRVRPGIALEPVPGPVRERLSVRDVRWRLYRRVIEIRDGRLALRRYLRQWRGSAAQRPDAAGGAAASARREGEALAHAILSAEEEPAVADELPSSEVPPSPVGMAGEVAYLTEVSQRYVEVLEEAQAHDESPRTTA